MQRAHVCMTHRTCVLPCPTQQPTLCKDDIYGELVQLPQRSCGQQDELVTRPQPSRGSALLQLQAVDNLRIGRGSQGVASRFEAIRHR